MHQVWYCVLVVVLIPDFGTPTAKPVTMLMMDVGTLRKLVTMLDVGTLRKPVTMLYTVVLVPILLGSEALETVVAPD